MKYFGIIDENVAAIFQLQWKIGNISDIFLQYSVLCGFRYTFAFIGIGTDLCTEFLPNPNRDVNYYATEHL